MFDSKSTVRGRPQPVNVFYVWYTELCRRLNSNPVPAVKPAKPKSPTVLDFVGDRLKVEEWTPVISALRHDKSLHVINIRSRIGHKRLFLHDIDTEEKVKKLTKKGALLWTSFILNSLLKSLSFALRNTQVLSCLELDGLPVFNQYLKPLLEAMKRNKSIKFLSFTNCPIQDIGCQMVCAYLRFTPNVEVLNLSGCNLTSQSGLHLAKLIKFQQINRYCESWHNSLRYEDPEAVGMRGIKRVTLNTNPLLGDDGLEYILNELEDDLWIKAIDLQKCGITDNISERILQVLENNKSLEILDVRLNQLISLSTQERIFQMLKDKLQNNVQQAEYQWCNTQVSLTWRSQSESKSRLSQISSDTSTNKKLNKTQPELLRNGFIGKNLACDSMLKKSISSGKNDWTKDRYAGVVNKSNCQFGKAERKHEMHNNDKIKTKSVKLVKCPSAVMHKNTDTKSHKSGLKIEMPQVVNGHNKQKNGFSKMDTHQHSFENSVRNMYTNGMSSALINSASKTFQKLLFNGTIVEDNNKADNELLIYFRNQEKRNNKGNNDRSCGDDFENGSQISLYKLMNEFQQNAT